MARITTGNGAQKDRQDLMIRLLGTALICIGLLGLLVVVGDVLLIVLLVR